MIVLGGVASERAFADPWYCAFIIGDQGLEVEEADPEPRFRGAFGGAFPGHEPIGGPGIPALPKE